LRLGDVLVKNFDEYVIFQKFGSDIIRILIK